MPRRDGKADNPFVLIARTARTAAGKAEETKSKRALEDIADRLEELTDEFEENDIRRSEVDAVEAYGEFLRKAKVAEVSGVSVSVANPSIEVEKASKAAEAGALSYLVDR